MKTQFRDPDGILNSLNNIVAPEREHIFYALLEAAQSFDLCMIRRNNVMSLEQKTALIDKASRPLTLKMQLRLYFRNLLGMILRDVINELELPKTLNEYLLFDTS